MRTPFRKWTRRDSNSDFRPAEAVSCRFDHEPFEMSVASATDRRDGSPSWRSVDPMGVEPIAPILQGSVAARGQAQLDRDGLLPAAEVRPGIEPGPPPYHGGMRPSAPTDRWK